MMLKFSNFKSQLVFLKPKLLNLVVEIIALMSDLIVDNVKMLLFVEGKIMFGLLLENGDLILEILLLLQQLNFQLTATVLAIERLNFEFAALLIDDLDLFAEVQVFLFQLHNI
jgi:hypothetical protein